MLADRIEDRTARIAVIGIGYIGLPLAVRFAINGFQVTAVDIDREKLERIADGRSTIDDLPDALVKEAVDTGRLTTCFVERVSKKNRSEVLERLFGVHVFVICVHTPLISKPPSERHVREPNTEWIKESASLLDRLARAQVEAGNLPEERLVVLESTTYPGATRELFSPLLERNGEFSTYLAYSPERRNPGHNEKEMFAIPRIVGGIDAASRDHAEQLYSSIFKKVHTVGSLETAEFVKLLENAFRFLSIGFANEMAGAARLFDIDIWQAIAAARTKGFGFELCEPGLIGGHCIPVDPHYLINAVEKEGGDLPLLQSAAKSHLDFRLEALRLLNQMLDQHCKRLAGSEILFWGISYKADVGDTRDSGVVELMLLLHAYGARLSFWDPVYAAMPRGSSLAADHPREEWLKLAKKAPLLAGPGKPRSERFEPWEVNHPADPGERRAFYEGFDVVVIGTCHTGFRAAYADLVATGVPIVDLCNAIPQWLEKLEPEQRPTTAQALTASARLMLLGRDGEAPRPVSESAAPSP